MIQWDRIWMKRDEHDTRFWHMQTWPPSWRGSPFVAGRLYHVVEIPTSGFPYSKPTVGDLLMYSQSGYSRYDNCSIYEFVAETGERVEWWLHDEKPMENWQTVFAPAEATA